MKKKKEFFQKKGVLQFDWSKFNITRFNLNAKLGLYHIVAVAIQ